MEKDKIYALGLLAMIAGSLHLLVPDPERGATRLRDHVRANQGPAAPNEQAFRPQPKRMQQMSKMHDQRLHTERIVATE